MVRSTTPINGYCNHNTVDLGGITAAALSVLTDKTDRAMFVAGNLIHNKIFTTFWSDGWYPEGNAYFQYVSFHFKIHGTVNVKLGIWNGRADELSSCLWLCTCAVRGTPIPHPFDYLPAVSGMVSCEFVLKHTSGSIDMLYTTEAAMRPICCKGIMSNGYSYPLCYTY